MKTFTASVLFACVCVVLVLAASPEAQSQNPTAVETLKQLERDIGDAMVAGDIDKLNQIYADDWAAIGSSGKIFTKESLLRDFRSGKDKLVSFELGRVDVQVFGNVAVAHGSVTEKRIYDGKDTSGESVYMDLLKKRAGKWVVVRTAGARVKADSPEAPSKDIDTVKQLERDMGDAMVAGDIDKLNQIYADDWADMGSSGETTTKETLLRDFKSFHDKLESFELGPTDVQVFGNVAVAHGNVTEKRTRDGKDTSGEFAWMDLLEKRADKWLVVRSAGARVK